MKKPIELDLLIIDYDDTFVDCYKPTLEALKKTVKIYLSDFIGIEFEDEEILSDDEIMEVWKKGNFFTMEELASVFIQYFLSLLGKNYCESEYCELSGIDIFREFKKRNAKSIEKSSELLKKKDIRKFAESIWELGGGIKAVEKITGRKNRWLNFSEGYITMDNFVLRLYKEIYLGEELFFEKYQQKRIFFKDQGQILYEKITIPKEKLKKLQNYYPIMLVSERNYSEVYCTLQNNSVKDLIDVVIANEPFLFPEDEYILGSSYKLPGERSYFSKIMEGILKLKEQTGFRDFVKIGYFGKVNAEEKSLRPLYDLFQIFVILLTKESSPLKNSDIQKREANFIIEKPEKILEILGVE